MNKNKYPDWLLPTALIIIAIIGIPLFGIYQFYYWKELADESDYDLLNAVISLSVGTLGIITIIFLYINYRQQQKQIDDNKRDVEYNRTLDILYKQIEHTNKFIQNSRLIEEFEETYEKIVKLPISLEFKAMLHLPTLYRLVQRSNDIINIYRKIIVERNLKEETNNLLNTILKSNIDPRLLPMLMQCRMFVERIDSLHPKKVIHKSQKNTQILYNTLHLLQEINSYFDNVMVSHGTVENMRG